MCSKSCSTRLKPGLCTAVATLNHGSTPLTTLCHKPQGTGYDPKEDVHFHDPMVDAMPNAPSLKMFNIYGVGINTER